jgi:hypothetical protein
MIIVHYPKDGITYMKGQCGNHSVSSTKDLKDVTCKECLNLVASTTNTP